jgi:lytic murein transglycosylase
MARTAGDVTMRAADKRDRAILSRVSRALTMAVAATVLAAAGARAEDCGHGPEGFSQWLNSFKQVAQGNGVSASAANAALDGVSYDPTVKRHDGGVAMFGHNFAGFAASHVTPGMVSRGKAELKRYAAPLATIEQRFGVPGPVLVAIWGQETSFGGDSGSFPTYSALATLAWDCRRAERYRAELVDALMLVERGIVQHPRELRGAWAGEIGQTQLMPSAYLMFATTPDGNGTPDLIHNSADALASTAAFLKGHGWQPGQGWDEGEPNFAAILQWNSAEIYAKTVALFADRLAGR